MFKTSREFYKAVREIPNVSEAIFEYAGKEIEKMDARNKKRTEKPSKASIANAPIRAAILKLIEDGEVHISSKTAAEVGSTTGVVSSIFQKLADEGIVSVTDYKEKGKSKVKGYTLISFIE